MTLYFYSRLLLYLLAFFIPVIHPAVTVPYDRAGWLLWFVLVPGQMLIAYHMAPPRFRPRTWLLSALGLIAATAAAGTALLSLQSLVFLGVGAASFLLTALIFPVMTGVTVIFGAEEEL